MTPNPKYAKYDPLSPGHTFANPAFQAKVAAALGVSAR